MRGGRYRAYPEYKDSGVEWLDDIPKHWDAWKLNHFAPIITCGVAATPEYAGEGVIFLSAQNVKKRRIDLTKGFKYITRKAHENLTKNRAPSRDDILLSRVGTVGEVCIVDVDFEFSIFVSLTHLRLNQIVCTNRFFVFLFQAAYTKALHGSVTLVGGGVGNLNVNDLREYRLPIPPCGEQYQIANFLDHETAKIDRLIEKQQQLIKLLKEKRQAVISHAVTKGLNPDAPMRDSGVEWLGEVPAHWSIKYLTHLVAQDRRIMYGIVLPGPNVDEGVPIVKGGDVKPGRLTLSSLCKTTYEIESGYERSRLVEGDLVYSIRGTIGDVQIVPKEIEGANLTQDAARIAPRHGVYNVWLKYAMESTQTFSQLEIGSLGAAVKGINIRDLKKAILPIPPNSEVVEIADYLDGILAKMNRLSEKCVRQVQLLQERRTALISAAVTGKIDVRNWQNPNETNTAKEDAA